MTIIKIGKGYLVTSAVNKEIPVTPPSIKELGNKNPSKPNPAAKIPIKIKNASFIKWIVVTLSL